MKENRVKGITLIEILVVVAIIALLLSIVIPASDRGHPGPRRVVCAYNSGKMCLAVHLYHKDKHGWPETKEWCDLIKPLFAESERNVFLCPADKIGPCSYAMNENIPADVNELPPDLVLLFESAPGWNTVGGPEDVVTDRHGTPGANIAFADGHVEFAKPEDIARLRWTIDNP